MTDRKSASIPKMFEDMSSRNRRGGDDPNFVARFGGQQKEEVQRLDSERSAGANIELANRSSGNGNKLKVHENYQSMYGDTKK